MRAPARIRACADNVDRPHQTGVGADDDFLRHEGTPRSQLRLVPPVHLDRQRLRHEAVALRLDGGQVRRRDRAGEIDERGARVVLRFQLGDVVEGWGLGRRAGFGDEILGARGERGEVPHREADDVPCGVDA